LDHISGSENTVYKWLNVKKYAIAICCLPENKGISFIDIAPAKLRDL